VGGGINTPEKAATAAKAGADIIVVGNALEKSTDRLLEFAEAIHNS
jgi:putative glycerol-1-phosphate prenyltransferase